MAQAELFFVPLGGVGEIGMNLGLYGLEVDGSTSWLMVDCGITFAEGDQLPGVEVILPDIRFIEEDRGALAGIVLTHGHEDHIGAILELWPRLTKPVYATPFTAGLIEAKAIENAGSPKVDIRVVPKGGRVKIGPFDVEFIPVAHSIPESHALAIRTTAGRVLHTGDWKLDPTPPLGDVTALDRLAAFGAEGVDVVVGDSTNAVRDGRSPSEADVAKVLAELVRTAPGRVCFTLFASNIGRVDSIARAALAAERDVVVLGRALDRNIRVARECGYLADLPDFLGNDAYGYLPRDKCVALLTGSQGEERSALARVARGDHPHVALSKGDRLVFSSRTIPGNERAVGAMLNGLITQGIEVITDRTHLVHVSGHPRTAELKELYDLIRPRAVLPVHGEPLHLSVHADLARAWGVPESLVASNGAVIRLAPGPLEVVDQVPCGRLFRDGDLLLEEDDTDTIPQRRRLQWSGIVSIAIALSSKGEIMADPIVQTTGVPDLGQSGRSMLETIENTVDGVVEGLPKPRRKDRKLVEDAVVRAVRAAVDEEWGKKPVCHVSVLVV